MAYRTACTTYTSRDTVLLHFLFIYISIKLPQVMSKSQIKYQISLTV